MSHSITHNRQTESISLSRRLRRLVSLIDQDVIADIGCDHALLCTAAIAQKKAKKAYACDLRKGPLRQAEANIRRFGLEESISIRLQNGLENLPDDAEQIIIAGMGGKLIEQILQANPPQKPVVSLLLSPHNDVIDLRRFLIENGYQIDGEVMVEDDGFYPILIVRPPHAADTIKHTISERELLYGVHPRADEDYKNFLRWKLEGYRKIEAQLPAAKRGLYARETLEAQTLLKELDEVKA